MGLAILQTCILGRIYHLLSFDFVPATLLVQPWQQGSVYTEHRVGYLMHTIKIQTERKLLHKQRFSKMR